MSAEEEWVRRKIEATKRTLAGIVRRNSDLAEYRATVRALRDYQEQLALLERQGGAA